MDVAESSLEGSSERRVSRNQDSEPLRPALARRNLSSRNGKSTDRRRFIGFVSAKVERLARAADPDDGLCLVTSRPEAVQARQIVVAGQTSTDTTIQLEYAWGLQRGGLNLNSRYNVVFLRSDWRILLDEGTWLLVPLLEVLERLRDATVRPDLSTPREDINKIYQKKELFEYHVTPLTPAMAVPICWFASLERDAPHEHHLPPYDALGSITSHARPHYIVFYFGRKLNELREKNPDLWVESRAKLVADLGIILRSVSNASRTVELLDELYEHWLGIEVPPEFCNTRPNRVDHLSNSDLSMSGPSANGESKYSDRGQYPEDEDHNMSGSSNQSAMITQGEDDDSEPLDEGSLVSSNVDDSPLLPEDLARISDWIEESVEAASLESGWQDSVFNEEQVSEYAKEPAWPAPPPESWAKWVPEQWEPQLPNSPHFWNTSKFSANDWALYLDYGPLFGRARR